MAIDMYSQDEWSAHKHCWGEYRGLDVTWWFDNGWLCRHPEWH